MVTVVTRWMRVDGIALVIGASTRIEKWPASHDAGLEVSQAALPSA
jgi:hypothetical protein